ncbi:MAG: DNA repair protein RecN [Candidatus Omnitrophota bacterium]
MLLSLRIANFVLIDDCRIDFHSGLNALTGETGAGKSIIADALNFLLGERGSPDKARDAKRDAFVEAEFQLDPASPNTKTILRLLEESGIPAEEETLLLSRSLSPSGRNRIFINNTQCLLKILRPVGALLVDLHGQHEHQSLLDKSSYRPLLDDFGDYGETLQRYRSAYREWTQILDRLHRLENDDRERRRLLEALRFQREEIDAAGLIPGEEEEIEARMRIIQHAERLSACCGDLEASFNESESSKPSLLDELDRLDGLLHEMSRLDPSLSTLIDSWQSAMISIQEIAREIQSYSQKLEFDPDELEKLHQRRFLIKTLKSKYGADIQDVLNYRDKIEKDLFEIENFEEECEKCRQEEVRIRSDLFPLAQQLHEARVVTANDISASVTSELEFLGMKQARFEIMVQFRENKAEGAPLPAEYGPEGADNVEYMVTTIPDLPARPLREVASGGEISRIMLALKCALSRVDPVAMMVFDEIDVGVGGKTAEAVAERLASLAKRKQVLCITHLPQIASRADRNMRVEKLEKDGKLVSAVTLLKGKERELELARMLGREDSAASQRYARELLQRSSS